MALACTRSMLVALLVLLSIGPSAAALVEPYAGGGLGDGLAATEAPLQPMGVAVDAEGNVYVSDQATARVRRVDAASGLVSTVVGGRYGFCGYTGPGTAVCLAEPRGLSVDAAGNVLIAQSTGVALRWEAATGLVTHVAGRSQYDGAPCRTGDGIPATEACLGGVTDVAPDPSTGGAFVLGSSGRRVYRVDGTSGLAARYAGCLRDDDVQSGEGGPATAACLGHGEGLAVDAAGNVHVASLFEGRIWRVDAATGLIDRVAGGGRGPACSADDIPATEACLTPRDITVDGAGNLFTIGFQGSGIRRVDAGTRQLTNVTPGPGEWQIDAGADGFLYTAGTTRIHRIDPAAGTAIPIAGNGSTSFCGEGVPASQACLSRVQDIAAAADGTLFLADPFDSNRIRRVDAATGVVTTIAEGGVCRGAPDVDPAQVCFDERVVLAAAPGGEVILADWHGNEDDGTRQLVRRLDPATGALTTIAGRCATFETDGVPALDACVNVVDLAADADGNVFLAEWSRVRRIDTASGTIVTIAGSGRDSCPPDRDPTGPATATCLGAHRVALAPDGTLHIVSRAPNGFDVVLRHDAAAGTLSRVAGRSDPACERVPDGAPATAGCLDIQSVAVDAGGNLLLGSRGVVRLVEAGSRIVTTIAGRRPDPDGFDPCCEACPNPPECLRATDLALDPSGRLFTAEPEKRQVRRVTLTCGDGVVGDGEACDDGNLVSGDGCDATCRPSRCAASPPPTACDGQPVPGILARTTERSCRLVGRLAAAGTPRRIRHVERAMAKTRRAAFRLIERAARREPLDGACVAALRASFE